MKVLLTPHQEKFIGKIMKGGGYCSEDEVVREALQVHELVLRPRTTTRSLKPR